jgi:hypothetical protein
MSECLGECANQFDSMVCPQPYSAFVGGDHEIVLHCPKSKRQRFGLRMVAHSGCYALVSGALRNNVTAVADMCPEGGLIRLDVVGAENVIALTDRDISCAGRRHPNRERIFLGDILLIGVGFSSPKHRFDDAPDIIPIGRFDKANLDYVGLQCVLVETERRRIKQFLVFIGQIVARLVSRRCSDFASVSIIVRFWKEIRHTLA